MTLNALKEMAGEVVDIHITADSNFPSLINLMRYNAQSKFVTLLPVLYLTVILCVLHINTTHFCLPNTGGPTVSGRDDHDYPNLNEMSMCFSNINQMKAYSKISLPSEIMEHFRRILLNNDSLLFNVFKYNFLMSN